MLRDIEGTKRFRWRTTKGREKAPLYTCAGPFLEDSTRVQSHLVTNQTDRNGIKQKKLERPGRFWKLPEKRRCRNRSAATEDNRGLTSYNSASHVLQSSLYYGSPNRLKKVL